MLHRMFLRTNLALVLVIGCGDEDPGLTEATASATPCLPGEQRPCTCDDGTEALETCTPSGAGFGLCAPCPESDPTTGSDTATADTDSVCGDRTCEVWETCKNCPDDCGACESCDLAPACAGNVQPPTISTPIDALMDTAQALTIGDHELRRAADRDPPALVVETAADRDPQAACDDPRLRIRLASVTVHEEYDDFNNDYVYCMIVTEAESQAEVRVTPVYGSGLAAGSTYEYSVAEGVVWGGDDQLVPPGGNMSITYNCYESDDTSDVQALLEAVGMAADGLGGIPIPGLDGWVLPAGQAASLINKVLEYNGDDHLFNASQTIDQALLLTLTQGRYWNVRRFGSVNFSDWDWELRMEAWGCTDDGTL